MTKLAFIDTETTGLDPDWHQIWEIGLIVREEGCPDQEFCWQLPVDLLMADPIALEVGRFHQRHAQGYAWDRDRPEDVPTVYSRESVAWSIAKLTHGAHLVGAVVSFDEERVRRLLRENNLIPPWHSHLVTVEALAAGYLAGVGQQAMNDGLIQEVDMHRVAPPWNSEELSRAVGVEPEKFDRHTAMGDARWAMAIYEAVMGS
ncbi:MAG TPA: hypothetical protein VHB02_06135 [Acidimicrobiales bacterium]|nr:hypothetical protein [Acidimicrobiales bacterium]